MSTILFNEIVFGPVKSRRLGVSLGVNLLPKFGKWCNFDCIYCECGFNKDGKEDKKLPTIDEVWEALEDKLKNHDQTIGRIDNITFSGNGEPTLHPYFFEIIAITNVLRDKYAKEAKVSVLTNGSRIGIKDIADALLKVDNAIIKIDSAIESSVRLIDRPQFDYSINKITTNLSPFKGKFVLQTMFLRGRFQGEYFDNTTDKEVNAWYEVIKNTEPREIMMYTIDRETPAQGLEKVTIEQMNRIAAPLIEAGFKITISG
ncbi:MAG: radical SAM protein [Bacteroidales bacterium]|nr:radical SAM protein [Bacteroidales bacterium]